MAERSEQARQCEAYAAAKNQHVFHDRRKGHGRMHQSFMVTIFIYCGKLQIAIQIKPHVLTPAGVSQANELDYTLHNPVSLQGVVIP